MMKSFSYFILLALICQSCVEAINNHQKLPPGIYRAVFNLNDPTIESAAEEINTKLNIVEPGELPFNFEVIYEEGSNEDFKIVLYNDDERLDVTDIRYGKDRATNRDTVLIKFPVYDTYIKAIYNEGVLEGDWFVNYRENYSIPFVAYHGQNYRFTNITKTNQYDISGKWKCKLVDDDGSEEFIIGNFVQNGNKLTGTFKTETGDYRFLEGDIIDNKFYLSVFDGSHAFLFEGKILDEGKIIGSFRSGVHYIATWEGVREDDFELTNPFELTSLKGGEDRINFSFPNINKEVVSLSDEVYKDKIKIIKIMGTWCPNCMDATNFLLEYLKKNNPDDIEVIAIAFERYRDENKSYSALKRYKEKKNIPFEILYGGYFDKAESTTKLPFLDKIISYPTILFVDKQNRLRKIHTGFSGPATDKYQEFKNGFDNIIAELKAEK